MSQMIVKTQELTKQYGHHRAVSSISMRVRKGAVYGLIGRNGAGKTTTIKIMTGLLEADEGQVLINGVNVTGGLSQLKLKIGYGSDPGSDV